MQLKVVKNEAHLVAGVSYLYLKEYIFSRPSCSPVTDFRSYAYKNKSSSRLLFFSLKCD